MYIIAVFTASLMPALNSALLFTAVMESAFSPKLEAALQPFLKILQPMGVGEVEKSMWYFL